MDGGDRWNGLPLAVLLDSAQKAEIHLAEETLGLVWDSNVALGIPRLRASNKTS
jgi:hypothetical protein